MKCQRLINPLGGPGAKLSRVPLQRRPQGLASWAGANFDGLLNQRVGAFLFRNAGAFHLKLGNVNNCGFI